MFLKPMLRESSRQWSLIDLATQRVIAPVVEAAFDSRTRKKGLLGRASLKGSALVIAPCSAVHTFFMRFAIDVVFADREGQVVKICHQVGPWRIAAAWRAFAAIELEAGAAEAAGLSIGSSITLRASD